MADYIDRLSSHANRGFDHKLAAGDALLVGYLADLAVAAGHSRSSRDALLGRESDRVLVQSISYLDTPAPEPTAAPQLLSTDTAQPPTGAAASQSDHSRTPALESSSDPQRF